MLKHQSPGQQFDAGSAQFSFVDGIVAKVQVEVQPLDLVLTLEQKQHIGAAELVAGEVEAERVRVAVLNYLLERIDRWTREVQIGYISAVEHIRLQRFEMILGKIDFLQPIWICSKQDGQHPKEYSEVLVVNA